MKTLNVLKKIGILSILIITVSSCEHYLEKVPLPSSELVTESAFQSKAVIDKVAYRMYSAFTNVTHQTIEPRLSALADDGYNPTTIPSYGRNFQECSLTEEDQYHGSWENIYRAIYLANYLIEELPNHTAEDLSDDERDEYLGAAYTIRAYCHYTLVRFLGAAPLVLTTDVTESEKIGRTPVSEIYTQIESDLTKAIDLLPTTKGDNYFINCRYIPQSILADVYLTQKKYDEAETAATAVISSGNYSLTADVSDVFLQNSSETVMATGYVIDFTNGRGPEKVADPGGNMLLPIGGFFGAFFEANIIAVSENLMSAFETGDERKDNWIELRNSAGYPDSTKRYFVAKYKHSQYALLFGATVPSGEEEDQKFIRLAELYLIRAEARAQQNNLATAASDLNMIRNRAGLGNITYTGQDDLISAIIKERRVEFFFEKAIRWFDLVRTGTADDVLSVISYKATNWKSHMVLGPIEPEVLEKNPNLDQNPGW